jgi:hypothetical protein
MPFADRRVLFDALAHDIQSNVGFGKQLYESFRLAQETKKQML